RRMSTAQTTAALLEQLHDAQEGEAAWLELREVLRQDPARTAAPLCATLLRSLESGDDLSASASILPAVEVCTRGDPGILDAVVLRNLLARAPRLDGLSTLCLALMLARIDAAGVISEGIQQVLAATEAALLVPDDPSQQELQEYERQVAHQLWREVGDGDAASLVALLEWWAEAVGWQRASCQLLADELVRVAPRNPDIIDTAIGVFETIAADPAAADGPLPPPDRYLGRLREIAASFQQRVAVAEIAAELRAEAGAVERPLALERPPVGPDPFVDRLIEEWLVEDRAASAMAWEPIAAALRDPTPPLVSGLWDAAFEVQEADPDDVRLGPLVATLYFVGERRPELVPTETLEDLLRQESLRDSPRTYVLALLARIRPDVVANGYLADALAAGMVSGRSVGRSILGALGSAHPPLLTGFAQRWFERMGRDQETGSALASALVEAAESHPSAAATMIELLRPQLPPPAPPGMIDLRPADVARAIERLTQIAGEAAP
ncbi:MAG: hypothetical protein ACRELX_10140, partial [Longimicrobiales bacterium]